MVSVIQKNRKNPPDCISVMKIMMIRKTMPDALQYCELGLNLLYCPKNYLTMQTILKVLIVE